jgi:cytochrome c biogenesis protein CcmG/thiol:disulfide interchange protein DsbE
MNPAIRKFLIPAVVVVLLGGLLAALLTPQQAANTSTATVTSKPAPDFTLKTLEGGTLTLSQFKGKPVVLNFFASWCGPCKDEAPMISAAAQEFKDVVFLGVAYNDKPDKAKEFRDQYELKFPIALDDDSDTGRASVNYALFSVPETYYIDREGIIQHHNPGPITRKDLEAGLKTIGAMQ